MEHTCRRHLSNQKEIIVALRDSNLIASVTQLCRPSNVLNLIQNQIQLTRERNTSRRVVRCKLQSSCSPVKKSKNKYDTSYLKRPQLTLSQQNILRMTGIQARGDDGSGLDYSNINNQKFNKNYHVQADYYGLFQKLGDHRKAREALRNEKNLPETTEQGSLRNRWTNMAARIQKRIDHAISKLMGHCQDEKFCQCQDLPLSTFHLSQTHRP